jgi:hypothetical protein
MYEYQIDPDATEKIWLVRHYPKWIPDIETHITDKPERAADEDLLAEEDIRAYSDGSSIEGGVGAAAVIMRGEEVIKVEGSTWARTQSTQCIKASLWE